MVNVVVLGAGEHIMSNWVHTTTVQCFMCVFTVFFCVIPLLHNVLLSTLLVKLYKLELLEENLRNKCAVAISFLFFYQ